MIQLTSTRGRVLVYCFNFTREPGGYASTVIQQHVHRYSSHGRDLMTPELKDNITAYYADLNAPFATRKSKDQWKTTLQDLDNLKAAPGTRVSITASKK